MLKRRISRNLVEENKNLSKEWINRSTRPTTILQYCSGHGNIRGDELERCRTDLPKVDLFYQNIWVGKRQIELPNCADDSETVWEISSEFKSLLFSRFIWLERTGRWKHSHMKYKSLIWSCHLTFLLLLESLHLKMRVNFIINKIYTRVAFVTSCDINYV